MSDAVKVLVSLNNNQLEMYDLGDKEANKSIVLALPGHRSDIRALSLSSDDTLLASASSGTLLTTTNTATTSYLTYLSRSGRGGQDLEPTNAELHPHNGVRLRPLRLFPSRQSTRT
jgi:WD40 repeat protein